MSLLTLQQTPLAQKPVPHCDGAAHAPPCGTGVLVGVEVTVGVLVGVAVGVFVGVAVAVLVGVDVGVLVGTGVPSITWQSEKRPCPQTAGDWLNPLMHPALAQAKDAVVKHFGSGPLEHCVHLVQSALTPLAAIHVTSNSPKTEIANGRMKTIAPRGARIAPSKLAAKGSPQMIWDVAAGIVIGGSVWALVLFGYALLGTRECPSPRRAVSRVHWG